MRNALQKEPYFGRLKQVLLQQGEPDRVPFYELGVDARVKAELFGRPLATLQDYIDCQVFLGYDYVHAGVAKLGYPVPGATGVDISGRERSFQNSTARAINSWAEFEAYPWPQPEQVDFSPVERVAGHLPEGMAIICRGGHMLEFVMQLMSYEGLAFALADAGDLVEAMFSKIGEMELFRYRQLVDMPEIGAFEVSDDLGFKTGLLLSPADLRRYVFPWYRRFVELIHAKGIPVILHSCGNLDAVLPDLLDIGFDAKHSYEDQIMPVNQAKEAFGGRMAVLGGIDVDFLCRATPNQVRQKVEQTLQDCMPGGGYALGSGNSIADYVPAANYYAMLQAGLEFGQYR